MLIVTWELFPMMQIIKNVFPWGDKNREKKGCHSV